MYLDIRTLEVAAIVVCSVLGPVSLAFGPGQPHMRPARFWGAGLVALAGGLALISMRGHASAYVLHVAGTGLAALGLTFAQTSALKVHDKGARDAAGWIVLGVIVLGLHILEQITANAWLHHVVGMGILGLLSCRVAYGFDRSRSLREGRALRAISLIFGFSGLLMVLDAASALVAADPDRPAGPGATDELLMVGLVAGLLLGTILLLWVMTERIHARMRQMVSLDPLTGVLNRPAFIRAYEREVARTRRRPDSRFAFLLFDVDHFRRVNDAYGHMAGDRLLANIVEIARPAIGKYDRIGRLEGDVFAVLMPGTSGEAAAGVAERMRREIEQQASVHVALKNPVTVSAGVAVFGEHGDRWDEVLRAAYAAAKIAKAGGGNRVIGAAPVVRPAGGKPVSQVVEYDQRVLAGHPV
jgi:diguanylate cyclase (GGDEF)-like protein